MLRNEKGDVALAIILSTLMTIGALAAFSLVSGRLNSTYRLYRRAQAILDAESASYVGYMALRQGGQPEKIIFLHPDDTPRKSVVLKREANKIQTISPYRGN